MTVQQGSDRAIVNWATFNVGANAGVNFLQPGASAVILNRVADSGGARPYEVILIPTRVRVFCSPTTASISMT